MSVKEQIVHENSIAEINLEKQKFQKSQFCKGLPAKIEAKKQIGINLPNVE